MPPELLFRPYLSWEKEQHICPSSINWNGRFNQKQLRKNKRRAHAAGCKNAFR